MAIEYLSLKEIVGSVLETVEHLVQQSFLLGVDVQSHVRITVSVQPKRTLYRRTVVGCKRHTGLVDKIRFIRYAQDLALRLLFLLIAGRISGEWLNQHPRATVACDRSMSGCVNDVAEGLPPVFVLVRVVLADVVLASAVAKGWFHPRC